MNAIAKVARLMTLEEFLVWDGDQDGHTWQLVDGVPKQMAPSSYAHAAIQSELNKLISNHLEATESELAVLSQAGVAIRVAQRRNYRIPDLIVAPGRPPEGGYLTHPVLVIEILSPSNVAETWSNVMTYTTQPSVQEIVIVHSQTMLAEVLVRDRGGTWPANPTDVEAGNLTFASIGLTVALAAVYRTAGLA